MSAAVLTQRLDLGPYQAVIRSRVGEVHLSLRVPDPFPHGTVVTVANFMPDAATAAQLRAIADHLEGLGC